MGKWIPNAAYSLLSYSVGYFSGPGSEYSENATVMVKATILATLTSDLLKHTFDQKRPNGGGNMSFPSGHTTSAFAFAAVIGDRHSLLYSIPAYIMAAAVAYQRMNTHKHYLHDVIMGATLGISFGLGISKYTRQKGKTNLSTNILFHESKPAGIRVVYNF